MALVFSEHVETDSPTVAGFALDGAKTTSTWLLEQGTGASNAITAKDLADAITQIVGGTTYAAGDGRLQRTPPLADPCYPWLFADSISSIRGTGKYTKTAAQQQLEVPPLPNLALYTNYWFTINFTPRAYPVFTDANVKKQTGSWVNDAGHTQPYSYVTEYERYTDYQLSPQNETITAQIGTMIFDSTSNPGVDGKIFGASPKMQLPNQQLKITWYGVPYRYATSKNAYLPYWLGRINQNDFTIMGQIFPAGSLLYVGYNPIKYTPPVQQTAAVVPGVFSTDKLCNIEMSFLYTVRKATDLKAPPANGNFIQAGWNLLPWLPDRKFHFALSKPDTTLFPGTARTPSWLSFPMETLFYDPDGAGAYDITTSTT